MDLEQYYSRCGELFTVTVERADQSELTSRDKSLQEIPLELDNASYLIKVGFMPSSKLEMAPTIFFDEGQIGKIRATAKSAYVAHTSRYPEQFGEQRLCLMFIQRCVSIYLKNSDYYTDAVSSNYSAMQFSAQRVSVA